MPADAVWARPDRLRRFRVTAGALADGLAIRQGALSDAVELYRARTDAAFEADVAVTDDAIGAIGSTVRCLGEWVGRVGDAFDAIGTFNGRGVGSLAELNRRLPPELRLDAGGDGGHGAGGGDGSADVADVGLTVLFTAASGTGSADVRAVSAVLGGPGRGAGAAAGAAASTGSRAARGLGRMLDVVGAGRVGVGEAAHRWASEPDLDTMERGARAAVDGIIVGGMAYGGAGWGASVGANACLATVPPAAPVCGAIGARVGGGLGARVGEWVTDRLFGDEPEPWERDPERLAADIAEADPEIVEELREGVDATAADARLDAERHTDFVMDHPWMWDDEHPSAPHVDPPPAGPEQPAHGVA